MSEVLAVVADLMLSSRVTESLRAGGHEVRVLADLPETVPDGCEVLVCDLEIVDARSAASLGLPTLGFYSHVDVETRKRSLAAGLDLVVPRSRMARELPGLVDGLVQAAGD